MIQTAVPLKPEHEYLERGDYFTYVEQTLLPEQVSHYSTDISAAWQVVEKVHTKNFLGNDTFALHRVTTGWSAQFGGVEFFIADTAPLAICRAALKAMGEK